MSEAGKGKETGATKRAWPSDWEQQLPADAAAWIFFFMAGDLRPIFDRFAKIAGYSRRLQP